MKILIYITLFLIPFQGIAQEFVDKEYYLIDSLVLEELVEGDKQLLESSLKLYHTAKEDTSKIKALYSISENMMHDDWSKYQFLQHKLIEKALFKTPLKLEREFLLKYLASSLNNIGVIYDEQGNVIKALEQYHQSLKIQEEIEDNAGEAQSLNNIGVIYNSQNNLNEALDCFQKSLGIREELGDMGGIAKCYNNIGRVYQKQRQYKNSLKYYNQSLSIQKKIGDKEGVAKNLNDLGVVFQQQGDYKKALETYPKSVKIYEEIGSRIGLATGLHNIGSIHFEQENFKKAKKFAIRSLELAKESGSIQIISKAARLLSRILKKEKKGLRALEMFEFYILMRDSLNNELTQKAVVQQEAKYEYEKQKTIDDAEHDKLLAIEQEEKEKQQILTTATGVGLGLVVAFLIFVFNRLQVTKKQKIVIEKQKEVVELAHTELEGKNKEITDSITYAKRIQSAILPARKVVKEYLQESFILYKPKDIVAGDFYWLEAINDRVLFAAADCTGHGVPGAMVSVVCNNALNKSVREHGLTDPGEILTKTRNIVIQEFEKSDEEVKDGMDIAICSLEENKLQYAGAHNPLWIIRKGEIIETKANKQPIGQFDNPEPYTTHSFELEKGDSIYIFSDGYVDQFGGEKGKKFKTKAFRELLLSIQDKKMEEQKIFIDEAFETWRGSLEQIDDVCVIGVRI